nr:hypothetical protein [Oryza sativa Japonica Group]
MEGAQMTRMKDDVARDDGGESERLHEDGGAPPPTFRPLLNDGCTGAAIVLPLSFTQRPQLHLLSTAAMSSGDRT